MRRRLALGSLAAAALVAPFVPLLAATGSSATVAQSLPVGVHQSSEGTTVFAGEVGVFVGNDGRVCPLVSTQDWQCVQTP